MNFFKKPLCVAIALSAGVASVADAQTIQDRVDYRPSSNIYLADRAVFDGTDPEKPDLCGGYCDANGQYYLAGAAAEPYFADFQVNLLYDGSHNDDIDVHNDNGIDAMDPYLTEPTPNPQLNFGEGKYFSFAFSASGNAEVRSIQIDPGSSEPFSQYTTSSADWAMTGLNHTPLSGSWVDTDDSGTLSDGDYLRVDSQVYQTFPSMLGSMSYLPSAGSLNDGLSSTPATTEVHGYTYRDNDPGEAGLFVGLLEVDLTGDADPGDIDPLPAYHVGALVMYSSSDSSGVLQDSNQLVTVGNGSIPATSWTIHTESGASGFGDIDLTTGIVSANFADSTGAGETASISGSTYFQDEVVFDQSGIVTISLTSAGTGLSISANGGSASGQIVTMAMLVPDSLVPPANFGLCSWVYGNGSTPPDYAAYRAVLFPDTVLENTSHDVEVVAGDTYVLCVDTMVMSSLSNGASGSGNFINTVSLSPASGSFTSGSGQLLSGSPNYTSALYGGIFPSSGQTVFAAGTGHTQGSASSMSSVTAQDAITFSVDGMVTMKLDTLTLGGFSFDIPTASGQGLGQFQLTSSLNGCWSQGDGVSAMHMNDTVNPWVPNAMITDSFQYQVTAGVEYILCTQLMGMIDTTGMIAGFADFQPAITFELPAGMTYSSVSGVYASQSPLDLGGGTETDPIQPLANLNPDPDNDPTTPDPFVLPVVSCSPANIDDCPPVFYDPIVATGYEYSVSSPGLEFASVMIPSALPNGDNSFTLVVDGISQPLQAGDTVVFDEGVTTFIIEDIDTAELLDPEDEFAFVTALTFSGGFVENATFTMTPITVETDIEPEPEPGPGPGPGPDTETPPGCAYNPNGSPSTLLLLMLACLLFYGRNVRCLGGK